MFENRINEFLAKVPLPQLDNFIDQILETLEPLNILEPVRKKATKLSHESVSTLRSAGKYFDKTSRKQDFVVLAEYLETIRDFLHREEHFNLPAFKLLQDEWSNLNLESEELKSLLPEISKSVYAYIVCSHFASEVKSRRNPLSTSTQELAQLSALELFNKLIDFIMPYEHLGQAHPSTEPTLKSEFLNEALVECGIPEHSRKSFADELTSTVEIFIQLKVEILKQALTGGYTNEAFEYAVEHARRSASNREIEPQLVEQYAALLINNLLDDPESTTQELMIRVTENLESVLKFCEHENRILGQLNRDRECPISSRFANLGSFVTALTNLQNPAGQYLLSKFYFEYYNPNYSLEESIFWASCSAFRSYHPAKKQLVMLHLIADNHKLANSLCSAVAKECEDPEINYIRASFLSQSSNSFEKRLAERFATKAADDGHAGATCLLAKQAYWKWKLGSSSQHSDTAMAFYERAAALGFGRAIVEIELHKLKGWERPAKYLQQPSEEVQVQILNIDENESAAYRFLQQCNKTDTDRQTERLLAIAKETGLLTNKYLIGKLLLHSDHGIAILEESGRGGHPEACLKLSQFYEQNRSDYLMALKWFELYMNNELMFAGDYKIDYSRIDYLKQKICEKRSKRGP